MPSDHKEERQPEKSERTSMRTPSRSKVSEGGRQSMRGPEKIGDRMPSNYEYANKVYSLEGKDPELHRKYPEGVGFDSAGFPDFSPYATKTVEIDMAGDREEDEKKANEVAGLEKTPKEDTWHHHQDLKTMQLVPADLHNAVRHTGGVAIIETKKQEL